MDKLFRGPEVFSFDGPDVAQRWARWEKAFRTFFVASEYKKKPKNIQVAILLNCAGLEAQEVHEQFEFEEEAEADDVDKVLEKLEEYCNPRKSEVYERTDLGVEINKVRNLLTSGYPVYLLHTPLNCKYPPLFGKLYNSLLLFLSCACIYIEYFYFLTVNILFWLLEGLRYIHM